MPFSVSIIDHVAEIDADAHTGVSWEEYEQFLAELGDRRLPHSYADGELRYMAPGFNHDRLKRWFARLIDALTEELLLTCLSMGSTTLRSAFAQRGAEPDEAYLIQNAAAMRGRRDYDIDSDPPPDLVVEIDVTSHSVDRLRVYTSLRVPEVWVFKDEALQVKLLRDGNYEESDRSVAFPFLPIAEFATWIERAYELDETEWIMQFRKWVRGTLKVDDMGSGS